MSVSVYVCIHICLYPYMSIYVYVDIRICLYAYMPICAHNARALGPGALRGAPLPHFAGRPCTLPVPTLPVVALHFAGPHFARLFLFYF